MCGALGQQRPQQVLCNPCTKCAMHMERLECAFPQSSCCLLRTLRLRLCVALCAARMPARRRPAWVNAPDP